MKSINHWHKLLAASALMLFATGCETTDGGNVSGSMYYGVGLSDPWYYGSYYDDPDYIVTPPPTRPERPPHVEQPIARPPTPRPMPSLPSTPRPSIRR